LRCNRPLARAQYGQNIVEYISTLAIAPQPVPPHPDD
jgi:hypothetical protein